ncbi:MAG: hypothetical protein FWD58_00650 [Firmicutes bacterium]|nr:hypothetical protein [Bacillota bacterium]
MGDKIEKTRQNLLRDRFKNTERTIRTTYIYGAEGTGKTTFVNRVLGYKYGDVFKVSNYKHSGKFDHYACQDIILFDEFLSQIELTDINDMQSTDRPVITFDGLLTNSTHYFEVRVAEVCDGGTLVDYASAPAGVYVTTEDHNFDIRWKSDAAGHWHECLNYGCDAVSDKEAHDLIWAGSGGQVNPDGSQNGNTALLCLICLYVAGGGNNGNIDPDDIKDNFTPVPNPGGNGKSQGPVSFITGASGTVTLGKGGGLLGDAGVVSAAGYTFTFSGVTSGVSGVTVNGEALGEGDYTVSGENDAEITLSSGYLLGLGAGVYDVEFTFGGGVKLSTSLTIVENLSGAGGLPPVAWLLIAIGALLVIGLLFFIILRRK